MAMKMMRQINLGGLLLGLLHSGVACVEMEEVEPPPLPVNSQPSEQLMVWDDFTQGFSSGASGSRWFSFNVGPFVGNDGVVSTSPGGGLTVTAAGRNPSTGQPAFTLTVPQETDSNSLPGGLDHVKWLAYMNHQASTGFPGFDASPERGLTCAMSISGRTFGTQLHPFGRTIHDSHNDLRLAAFGHVMTDFETFMTFSFIFTNNHVYAVYERLPFGWTAQNRYAAFAYAIPVAQRMPNDTHQTKISYERDAGVVRWNLDGKEVFKVSRLGHTLDRRWMLLEHGGREETVSMRQLDCGMGMFTLLDAAVGPAPGLVRLTRMPDFYYQPSMGVPTPLTFLDESSQTGSRLFGQGAMFHVGSALVSPQAP
jgi:hypothetical protein